MTELYSNEELTEVLKKRKSVIALGIGLPVLSVAFAVISFFVVDQGSLLAYKILTCSFLVISAWISIYLLSCSRIQANDKIEHLSQMLKGQRELALCEIFEIRSPKTVSENILAYEIFDKKNGVIYYFEAGSGSPPFMAGDLIKLEKVNNYVVAYEVQK